MSEPMEPISPMNGPESEPARTDANDRCTRCGADTEALRWCSELGRCPVLARSAAAAQPGGDKLPAAQAVPLATLLSDRVLDRVLDVLEARSHDAAGEGRVREGPHTLYRCFDDGGRLLYIALDVGFPDECLMAEILRDALGGDA